MKHYNFREIKEKGSCIDFAEKVLGAKVTDNRCVAVWRGGERDSVSIDKDKWYDHASQQGGGLIELCAIAKFGSTDFSAIQLAQEFLGNFLQLEEVKFRKVSSGHNRHDELLQEGYTETARYNYVDLSGKLLYFVCRMEHARYGAAVIVLDGADEARRLDLASEGEPLAAFAVVERHPLLHEVVVGRAARKH